ncbi:hypothetical protein J6590_005526, partial [Homalodisca vitripennis]
GAMTGRRHECHRGQDHKVTMGFVGPALECRPSVTMFVKFVSSRVTLGGNRSWL